MAFNFFQQKQTVASPQQQTQQQVQLQQTPAGNAAGTVAKATPAIDPNSPTSGMDAISAMYTSPEQEEKMRKASVANQRILAVADALRHIGNIYHTVKYAPSQQFNKPWEEEQTRYEKGKAVRDAANAHYLSYQQAKAAQDAKQKQWEADFQLKLGDAARKAGYTEAQIKNMQDRLAEQKANNEANRAYRRENDEANRKQRQAQYDKQNKFTQQRIGIAAQNSRNAQSYRQWKMNGGGSGGNKKIVPLDTPNGRIVPSGGTPNSQQMKQVYYAAKAIDEKNKDANGRYKEGYKPLTSGLSFSWSGSNEDFSKVYEALSRSGELADWTRDHLGWQYDNGSGGSIAPSIGWDDDEDEDDGLSIGW